MNDDMLYSLSRFTFVASVYRYPLNSEVVSVYKIFVYEYDKEPLLTCLQIAGNVLETLSHSVDIAYYAYVRHSRLSLRL